MRPILWAALLSLAACGSCDTVPAGAVTACQGVTVADARTDILFVVDDSASMATKQAILAANLAGFIDQLSRSPVRNDYQIGVTTTSVDRYDPSAGAFAGTFTGTSACSAPPYPAGAEYPAGALVSVTGGSGPASRVQSTANPPRILAAGSPTLIPDFTANVFVGVCGSSKEQGLEAMRRALSAPLLAGANSGLLRPGARLAVVLISDDEDCSDPDHGTASNEPGGGPVDTAWTACTGKPVQDYVDFLKGDIGGEKRSTVVAVITAVDPVTRQPAQCRVQNPDGTPGGVLAEHAATRYRDFAAAFGATGIVDSVCNASFQGTLSEVASRVGQEVPLSGAPADPRLLRVSVVKPDGTRVACQLAGTGSDAGPADVVYTPPDGGRPPTLTFGGPCKLEPGDRIDLALVCVG
jgi:hypothetical protein